MDGDEYIRQRIEWARLRLAALEAMEEKLREMKTLAELARDYSLNRVQLDRLNLRIGMLQSEVNGLDERTREDQFIGGLQ